MEKKCRSTDQLADTTCRQSFSGSFQKRAQKRNVPLPKTVQNEIIDSCYDHITDPISTEIKEATFFSVLVDEAQYSSNQEQMVLVIRFVEKIVRYEKTSSISSIVKLEPLACSNQILDRVRQLGLEKILLRGQRCDDAGNMSGKHVGTAKRIQDVYPKSVYVHCASHRLNLVVANICQIQRQGT